MRIDFDNLKALSFNSLFIQKIEKLARVNTGPAPVSAVPHPHIQDTKAEIAAGRWRGVAWRGVAWRPRLDTTGCSCVYHVVCSSGPNWGSSSATKREGGVAR